MSRPSRQRHRRLAELHRRLEKFTFNKSEGRGEGPPARGRGFQVRERCGSSGQEWSEGTLQGHVPVRGEVGGRRPHPLNPGRAKAPTSLSARRGISWKRPESMGVGEAGQGWARRGRRAPTGFPGRREDSGAQVRLWAPTQGNSVPGASPVPGGRETAFCEADAAAANRRRGQRDPCRHRGCGGRSASFRGNSREAAAAAEANSIQQAAPSQTSPPRAGHCPFPLPACPQEGPDWGLRFGGKKGQGGGQDAGVVALRPPSLPLRPPGSCRLPSRGHCSAPPRGGGPRGELGHRLSPQALGYPLS